MISFEHNDPPTGYERLSFEQRHMEGSLNIAYSSLNALAENDWPVTSMVLAMKALRPSACGTRQIRSKA